METDDYKDIWVGRREKVPEVPVKGLPFITRKPSSFFHVFCRQTLGSIFSYLLAARSRDGSWWSGP